MGSAAFPASGGADPRPEGIPVIHLLTFLACALVVVFAAMRSDGRHPDRLQRLESAYLRYEGEQAL